MFGYLKPFQDELKYKYVKEYKKYYCSVCNGLKREFGVIYSGFLNYEVVYLYLFIEGITDKSQGYEYSGRCPLNPFYKFKMNINQKILDYVCFINYYLVTKKVEDNCLDEKNILYKGLYLFLTSRKKFRRKSQEYSEVKSLLDEEMNVFNSLEKKSGAAFDELASSMGRVLEIIVKYYLKVENIGDETERDQASKISFHLGELIYLLDAIEDYDDDIKKGRFNPLIYLEIENSEKKREKELRHGMMMANLMIGQIQFLNRDIKYYFHEDILRNILKESLIYSLKKVTQKGTVERNSTDESENAKQKHNTNERS